MRAKLEYVLRETYCQAITRAETAEAKLKRIEEHANEHCMDDILNIIKGGE